MANQILESSWDCEVDGHEYEERGEYDPDTGSYPYLECKVCRHQIDWEPPEDYDDN